MYEFKNILPLLQGSIFIPTILLSPVGGIVADRVNKRTIMVVLDFFTAAVECHIDHGRQEQIYPTNSQKRFSNHRLILPDKVNAFFKIRFNDIPYVSTRNI